MTHSNNYWFRAKRYGWGWSLPLNWQGWMVLTSWLLVVLYFLFRVIPRHGPAHWLFLGAMGAVLFAICYWKGEPLRWRNGQSD